MLQPSLKITEFAALSSEEAAAYLNRSSIKALFTIMPVPVPVATALATVRILELLSPHAYTPATDV